MKIFARSSLFTPTVPSFKIITLEHFSSSKCMIVPCSATCWSQGGYQSIPRISFKETSVVFLTRSMKNSEESMCKTENDNLCRCNCLRRCLVNMPCIVENLHWKLDSQVVFWVNVVSDLRSIIKMNGSVYCNVATVDVKNS